MTSSLSLLEEDLSCPICCQIFKDPVILSCSHSYCRTCLKQYWAVNLGRECPVCRRRSSKEHPLLDLALRSACESYSQRKKRDDGDPVGVLCSLHSEKLCLFCVDDKKLVCVQCVSQNHQNHHFCSISKAAVPHKEKLQNHLRSLEKKLQVVKKIKDVSEKEATHIMSQAMQTERQIKEEFEKLHQFLRKEEKASIVALKKEEEEKSQRMKKKIKELGNQIQDISARIGELEEKLKDDALVLQDFQRTCERAQYTQSDPELDSGALIDVVKHLGNLRYRVWEKMKDLTPYFPVILDPNTANSSLILSEDLSSLSCSSTNSLLPENPERISAYSGVLGSEGFSSGTHSWEVDVEGNEMWIVGVAEESASRKESQGAVPENGFCCIWRNTDVIIAGISKTSVQTLLTKPTIKRIRVTLTWESGQVTFSNSDNNTNLYTFTYRFTKKMYPYFYSNSKSSLKVLPAHVSVK
ncbi:hypothetical protein SRHO_G00179580 [Serrasalmus rhombeus]